MIETHNIFGLDKMEIFLHLIEYRRDSARVTGELPKVIKDPRILLSGCCSQNLALTLWFKMTTKPQLPYQQPTIRNK